MVSGKRNQIDFDSTLKTTFLLKIFFPVFIKSQSRWRRSVDLKLVVSHFLAKKIARFQFLIEKIIQLFFISFPISLFFRNEWLKIKIFMTFKNCKTSQTRFCLLRNEDDGPCYEACHVESEIELKRAQFLKL